MTNRDKSLDGMRCLAMVWVIAVHCVYWGCFYEGAGMYSLLSLGLFEMPLFFFITGASNSLGRTEGYASFVYRRFRRILVPYWIYGAVCALVSMGAWEGLTALQAGKILLSWLIPWFGQITTLPYIKWIVWFVPVYLAMVLVLPVMKKLAAGKWRYLPLPVLAGLFLVTWRLGFYWVRIGVFYGLWTYLGLFYKRLRQGGQKLRIGLAVTALAGFGSLAVCYLLGMGLDLQNQKFPPTPVFFLYACAAISLLIPAMDPVGKAFAWLEERKAASWLVDLYSRRSTTIFLYQTFVFTAVVPLVRALIPGGGPVAGTLATVLCFALCVPACGCVAALLGRMEDLGGKKPV